MRSPTRDDALAFGGGVGAGLLAGEVMAQAASTGIKDGTVWSDVHHYQVGAMALPFGAMVPEGYRALYYGGCLGVILHDVKDLILGGGHAKERWPTLYGPKQAPAWSPSFQRHHIPDEWPRQRKYAYVARLIGDTVRRDRERPEVRELAIRTIGDLDGRNEPAVARRVQEYVRRSYRYVKDPSGLQVIQAVAATRRLRAGKCVDHAILVGSLLGALGYPSCGILYAQRRPLMYDHIMCGIMPSSTDGFPVGSVSGHHPQTGQPIIPLETIIPGGVPPGWEPRYLSRAIVNF
jgi:hypothetical protein